MARSKLPAIKKQTSKIALALLPDIELPFDTEQFANERIAVFLRAVFFGMAIEDARNLSGLSPHEYGEWLSRGGSKRSQRPVREPEEPYATFCELLEQLVIATKTVATANVLRAIWSGDVETSRWYLTRRYPQEYGEGAKLPVELIAHRDPSQVVIVMPDNQRPGQPPKDDRD